MIIDIGTIIRILTSQFVIHFKANGNLRFDLLLHHADAEADIVTIDETKNYSFKSNIRKKKKLRIDSKVDIQ